MILRSIFELEKLNLELEKLESLTLDSEFYKNTQNSQKVLKEISSIKSKISDIKEIIELNDNMNILFDFYKQEEASLKELEDETNMFVEKLETFKISASEAEVISPSSNRVVSIFSLNDFSSSS